MVNKTIEDKILTTEEQRTTVEDVLSRWNEVLHAVTSMVTRDRIIVKILVFSFIVDILLTAFIGFGAVHLHDISNQYQLLACHSSNAFKVSEKKLWEHVLAVTSPKHPTPAQLRVVYNFQHYLDKAMKLKSCSGL